MKKRKGFNPKRRIVTGGALAPDRLDWLLVQVTYTGNPEHKKYPGDYGLSPPANPRPGKTLCDARGALSKSDAEALLKSGIGKGMVSVQERSGWPQNVWAVSDTGVVFEAQLENREEGRYHGYPMPEDDDFRSEVIREWGGAVSIRLDIVPEWESLRYGTPEERACFAAVGIRYGSVWLTEVYDDFVKRVREKAHLSAYRLAEWFAWNWWRLRWEPRTDAADWAAAHRLTTVGGGYVWPNVEIVSDGERAVLRARPTQSRPEEPLRYVVDFAAIVRAGELESALDGFVDLVVEKLRSEGIGDTNLHHVWGDVRAERADPEMARRRKIEALLGFDPDEADGSVIDSLIADASVLGEGAMDEVAANRAQTGRAVTAGWLREVAEASGFVSSPRDSVRLAPGVGASPTGEMPAWKRGVELADALREQERLGTAPISNSRLAQMAGVQEKAIADAGRAGGDFAFALDEGEAEGRVVLSSKWGQGRRFELARLVGDRIGGGDGKERLLPATKSGTYRQKFQRAFAAELLCPFDTLEDRLAGDYSGEAIEDAAGHFEVSSLAVRTILVNHKRLDRENIGAVF